MYHHQPSYNPYAGPDPPQYAPQYGSWPELPQQEIPVSPDTFSSSFCRQSPSDQYPPYPQYQQSYPPYAPQSQQYSPQPPSPPPTTHWRRRTSVQQRWDDYIASEECSENLQGDRTYINQVTTELEQRAAADERIGALAQQQQHTGLINLQHAQQAERDRRLKWAQDMIIQSPALCAEVYFAMARRPPCNNSPAASGGSNTAAAAMPPPPPPPPPMAASRSNSSSSINSCAGDSSYSVSPT